MVILTQMASNAILNLLPKKGSLIKEGLKMIKALIFINLLFITTPSSAQLIINDAKQEILSIQEHAELWNAGEEGESFENFLQRDSETLFEKLDSRDENYGFYKGNLWLRFSIKNDTDRRLEYILETARPITDIVDLYLQDGLGNLTVQRNGDGIPFNQKTIEHRKSLFNITLDPNEEISAYLHLKSDGEVILLSLRLLSKEELLRRTYKEQLFFGFFYGILLFAGIIYLFFYFALGDRTFIYYSLYVFCMALLQFSLDGFSHQYILSNGGYIYDRAVLGSALAASFFLANYGLKFLVTGKRNKFLSLLNSIVSGLIVLTVVLLFTVPSFLEMCYPLANIIGLAVLLQTVLAIVFVIRKNQGVDPYFITGIMFLVLAFVMFILHNLNIIENSFYSENGPKLGIGLEIIFLSMSMSNRIRKLRKTNDINHALALQRAEDMNDIKSSFLSNISHELRTPLNLIMGVVGTLQENENRTLIKEQYGLVIKSSEELTGYIDDILDFTIIEKGETTLNESPFHLRTSFEKIVQKHLVEAEDKGLEFEINISNKLPEMVLGDRVKIVQILDALLDNAIKFTNKGHIKLEVSCKASKNGKIPIYISIADTGIGISQEKMTTLLEAFTKKSFLDKREFKGLGLGLYIVKSNVDLLGGNISYQKNVNKGVTCKVDLNLVEVQNPSMLKKELRPQVRENYDLQNCKILLVEDNTMNQLVIKMLVKKWKNVTLSIAGNGKEALETLSTNEFDIILMDLQMPVMDGFEATSKIREGKVGENVAQIPIIVLTADATESTKKEILRLGANDYMTKPVDGNELFNKIKQNLVAIQKKVF